jgi:hypothetical protein
VEGSYAYIADGFDGLRIIDVSDPVHPFQAGFFDTDGGAMDVIVQNNFAYVADGGEGLRIINISDPTHPLEVGFYDTGGWASDVAISGNFAYLADETDGLRVISIADPTAPIEVGFYNTQGSALGVVLNGSFAYVADGDDGLRIFDLASLQEVGFFDTGGFALGLTVSGPYIYVADGEDGLYIIENTLSSISRNEAGIIPGNFALFQNYPNPFNPRTTIGFQLPKATHVDVSIFSLLGEKVLMLLDGFKEAGYYQIDWNGTDRSGHKVATGVYFYRIQAGEFVESKKMILAK